MVELEQAPFWEPASTSFLFRLARSSSPFTYFEPSEDFGCLNPPSDPSTWSDVRCTALETFPGFQSFKFDLDAPVLLVRSLPVGQSLH